mmetsp:Transcript_2821/g.4093  ORF Transcript_2821/g.4093 Transcript_2821/m.4093 type:complete len:338 (+) Transcript_2821:84-1097(+)
MHRATAMFGLFAFCAVSSVVLLRSSSKATSSMLRRSAQLTRSRAVLPRMGYRSRTIASATIAPDAAIYSDPNQAQRFAQHKAENNQRVLDIDSVYDPSSLKGKTVLVTGANRGLGLQLATELVSVGAKVIGTTRKGTIDLEGIDQVIEGVDVATDNCMETLIKGLDGRKVDVLINNAGYFLKEPETIDNLNFDEEMKMIDICAVGPLRVAAALVNAGLMTEGSKIATITSQGGSIAWRDVQNADGPYDYGHHMSKCAANMMSKLLAMEMKAKGITVVALHPGFNKTKMTEKYKHIWEVEGAVDPAVGAKRVVHEVALADMEQSGKFINCEDGLQIPW